MRQKTGLLGGSFNPAHGGHRNISRFSIDRLALDEMWWLVSPGNPLKPRAGMAPLHARLARAMTMARRSRIRPTAIEQQLSTRYTIDTLRALVRRYPKRRFIWIMGADNLAQFHKWKHWRAVARLMPIAVIARPGYDGDARRAVASGWFAGHVHRADHAKGWTQWRPPALVHLRYRPDDRSATLLRQADPDWSRAFDNPALRDPVTHARVPEKE